MFCKPVLQPHSCIPYRPTVQSPPELGSSTWILCWLILPGLFSGSFSLSFFLKFIKIFLNQIKNFIFFQVKLRFYLFYFFTLQYCIGFAIHWHESATGVHVFPILNPPPSPPHPSGSSQCTSPEYPVSCIKSGLAIRFTYDNIHASMSFSQIIPPSPSPTESKRLFYTFVSLLLSRK